MKAIPTIIYAAAVGMLLISCSHADDPAQIPDGWHAGETVEVQVTVRTAGTPASRSMSDADENVVDDVTVLLFTPSASDASQPGTLYTSVGATNIEGGAASELRTFDARFGVDGTTPRELIAVVLANVATAVLADGSRVADVCAAAKGKTYAEVSALLAATASPSPSRLAMWGVCTPKIDTSLRANAIGATLLRSLARIDVDASAVAPSLFSLEEVRIAKVPSLVALMPSAALLGVSPVDGGVAVTAPSVPAAASVSDEPWTSPADTRWHFVCAGAGNISAQEVYIPECDVLMGGDGDPADTNRLHRATIIVGGRYKSGAATTYYRVDFSRGGRLFDVLRNHRFRVVITGVNGPGEDTPQKAYETISAGISAEIIEWTNIDTEIVFDGAHWLSVATKEVELGGSAGNEYALHVASDIDASDWLMRWEDDTDAVPDFSTAATLSGDLFGATRPEGDVSGGAALLLGTLHDMPDGAQPRSRVLRLRVSPRLEIPVRVTQYPRFGDDWTDGGNIATDDL